MNFPRRSVDHDRARTLGLLDRIRLTSLRARAIAFYEEDKFPWERSEIRALGEKREDYLKFMDRDDLTDEEYAALYGEKSDTTLTKEGSD